jgi:hypothetical protein
MRLESFNTEADQALPDLLAQIGERSRAKHTYARGQESHYALIKEHRKQLQSKKAIEVDHQKKFKI